MRFLRLRAIRQCPSLQHIGPPAYATRVRTHGNYTIKRQSVAVLTAAYCHGCQEALRELAHATRKINNGRLWLYQLLMLDGPGTGVDIRSFSAPCAYAHRYKTLVFQKRYLLDHLRLQIVRPRAG